jgi:hypothetical protein
LAISPTIGDFANYREIALQDACTAVAVAMPVLLQAMRSLLPF